jgi:large subunit ribosomal protein L23
MASVKPKPKPAPQKGPVLEMHQVVLAPIVSEKCTHLVERHNTYAFRVHALATKTQIKEAVEHLFDVHVESIRTQNRKGKSRRYKTVIGKTSSWKKAYVSLNENDRINLF